MNVTIFGGTLPQPGDLAYTEAERLGAILAKSGHVVITGGYIGTMEAASKGACFAGGHVIGVTCQQIENWRGSKANRWVLEERKVETLQERMIGLMDAADAILALPGGIGTLAEISLFWNRMVIQASPRKPFILIGSGWREITAALNTSLDDYFPSHHLDMLQFAATVEEAADLLAADARR